MFASNIGSGHFIGLAGSGAASGIGIAGFELSVSKIELFNFVIILRFELLINLIIVLVLSDSIFV